MSVTLPASRVAIASDGSLPSKEMYRWMHDVTEQLGGVSGPSTPDLSASQFEDAGIEEMRQDVFRLRDELRQAYSLVYSLSERLSAAERHIQSMLQGTLL